MLVKAFNDRLVRWKNAGMHLFSSPICKLEQLKHNYSRIGHVYSDVWKRQREHEALAPPSQQCFKYCGICISQDKRQGTRGWLWLKSVPEGNQNLNGMGRVQQGRRDPNNNYPRILQLLGYHSKTLVSQIGGFLPVSLATQGFLGLLARNAYSS